MVKRRYPPPRGVVALVLAAWLPIAACDSAGSSWGDADSYADLTIDLPVDSTLDPTVDMPPDTIVPDVAVDDGSGPCTYPAGPYAFNAVGNIVGPMAWPSAVKGPDDLSIAADLAAIRCEPGVKSIFVMIASTS